jgi:acyl dehydratase
MNKTLLGRTAPLYEVFVELGKIREFAKATFTDHPDFYAGRSSPPTFLTTCFHWTTPVADLLPLLELDPAKALQLQQEFTFHQEPPPAGTKLVAVASVDEMYDKEARQGRLECVVIVTRFRDDAGRLVATGRMTGAEVHRHGVTAGAAARSPREAPVVQPEPAASDLTVGPITMTDIVRYAGASGDFTPVHHDAEYCHRAGHEGPFAMGMLSAGAVGSWLVKQVPPSVVRGIAIRFHRQVWPGDVLTISGTRQDSRFEIHCTSQDGHLVTSAKAEVDVADGGTA